MAGDWIKMREDLYEDTAVLTMAKELGTRPEHIVGYCHRFWSWASRNCVPDLSLSDGDRCPDSVPISVPLLQLESVLSLPGFLEMMCKVGWLKYVETSSGPTLIVPKFDRHLSESAKRRALAAEKKRLQRVQKVSPIKRDKCPSKTGTREEKRREENIPPPPYPLLPMNGSSPDIDPLPGDWLEVVEVLFSEGMGAPQTACEAARSHGVMASEVMREVCHWQEHKPAWGIGLLYKVIAGMVPNRKVNWPEPGQEFAKSKSRLDIEKSQMKTANGRVAAEKERQKNLADNQRRELQFGKTLDDMPKKELRSLVETKFPAMLPSIPKRGPVKAGLLRNLLLDDMDASPLPSDTPHA